MRTSSSRPAIPARCALHGRLLDGDGEPLPDGMIEVWDRGGRRWGRSGTDADGGFAFTVAKPAAANGEAPRLDVYVFARGLLRHQLTRIYFPDEPEANAADPVLAALPSRPSVRRSSPRRTTAGASASTFASRATDETVFFAH